jgi:two-component system, cell cycle response regulator DivK
MNGNENGRRGPIAFPFPRGKRRRRKREPVPIRQPRDAGDEKILEPFMEKKIILVIEDNDLNRKLIRALLRSEDVRILEAQDAQSGMRLAREQRPDLVLMDIQLPGMDGLTATSILKKDPLLASMPIVALTSYAMAGDEEKARKAGCDGYITKPIDVHSFKDLICGLLQGGSAKEAAG